MRLLYFTVNTSLKSGSLIAPDRFRTLKKRLTRREVIEISADASPVHKDTVKRRTNMWVTAKQCLPLLLKSKDTNAISKKQFWVWSFRCVQNTKSGKEMAEPKAIFALP